MKVICS